jgi:hypothetical protein
MVAPFARNFAAVIDFIFEKLTPCDAGVGLCTRKYGGAYQKSCVAKKWYYTGLYFRYLTKISGLITNQLVT